MTATRTRRTARRGARWAAAAGVPVRVPASARRDGSALTWQVIGPVSELDGRHAEEGAGANNASLVLLVEVAASGCCWPATWSRRPSRLWTGHCPGCASTCSRCRTTAAATRTRSCSRACARLAVVSVGRDNDYGHPAAATLALLRRAGMRVERTDQDGDVAVTVWDGRLGVRHRGGR